MNENEEKRNNGVLFLGTGSSSGVPYAFEIMQPHTINSTRRRVVLSSVDTDPRYNKNYRCNPSILLKVDGKNIIIDVGKTFRESAIRWFPCNDITQVDAIILTHPHADAIFGLDDVRGLSAYNSTKAMDVHLSQDCLHTVSRMFPYLMPLPPPPEGAAVRKVSSIDWKVFHEYRTFEAAGLPIIPVPVMHGEDMKCMGFIFGRGQSVCYLSDISRMLPATLETISGRHIELLIVDALHVHHGHPFHFSMQQAIELSKQLKPKRVRFVGMSSDFDHEEVNARLREVSAREGIDFQLAYDGMFMDVDI